MKNYRVYCFDGANRISAAYVVTASNDAEAVQAGKKNMADCLRAELWDCDRLVMRIANHQTA